MWKYVFKYFDYENFFETEKYVQLKKIFRKN